MLAVRQLKWKSTPDTPTNSHLGLEGVERSPDRGKLGGEGLVHGNRKVCLGCPPRAWVQGQEGPGQRGVRASSLSLSSLGCKDGDSAQLTEGSELAWSQGTLTSHVVVDTMDQG